MIRFQEFDNPKDCAIIYNIKKSLIFLMWHNY